MRTRNRIALCAVVGLVLGLLAAPPSARAGCPPVEESAAAPPAVGSVSPIPSKATERCSQSAWSGNPSKDSSFHNEPKPAYCCLDCREPAKLYERQNPNAKPGAWPYRGGFRYHSS